MAGIGGISGMAGMAGANPLSGMGGIGGIGGLGDGSGGSSGSSGLGMAPNQQASGSQGSSFTDALKEMVIDGPSATKQAAGDLQARFAAGDTSIDPHQIAIASAKAGVEIQMATRTISAAVTAVRTLFQMQV